MEVDDEKEETKKDKDDKPSETRKEATQPHASSTDKPNIEGMYILIILP